jgi:PD-(D/E)XK nuclease superfamily
MSQIISSVSFSKLEEYLKCPQLFYQKYVLKSELVVKATKQEALLQGCLAHLLIEERLKQATQLTKKQIIVVIDEWLIHDCDLQIASDFEEMDTGGGLHLQSVYDCGVLIAEILNRCASTYTEDDKIRSKSGDVLADPLNYPSLSFKKALDESGANKLRFAIDLAAARCHEDFGDLKLSTALAKGLHFGLGFKPADAAKTLEIEYDLSSSKLEAAPEVAWRGFIDWIYTDDLGLHIVDHKTSKALPTESLVKHHEQLNLYAYLYYLATGKWADTIGINSLPTQQLIQVNLDRALSKSIYDYYCDLTQEICVPGRTWHKQPPSNTYISNCVKVYGRNVKICKALSQCWPSFDPQTINI